MLSTSIQRSSGWRRHGGRRSTRRGTPVRSAASRAAREISAAKGWVASIRRSTAWSISRPAPPPRRTRRSAPARQSVRDAGSGRPAPSSPPPGRQSARERRAPAPPLRRCPPRIKRCRPVVAPSGSAGLCPCRDFTGHAHPCAVHVPTRARKSPVRSTIATSTGVSPLRSPAPLRAPGAPPPRRAPGAARRRSREFPTRCRWPSGGDRSRVRAEFGEEARERGAIDPAAARMQVEMAGGELGELGEAAGQGQMRDRMAAQIFERAADKIAHVDEGVLGQIVKTAAPRAPMSCRSPRRCGPDRRRGRRRCRGGSHGSTTRRNRARRSRWCRAPTARR